MMNVEKVFKMRDATPEEQKAVNEYIKSISKETGVTFDELLDDAIDSYKNDKDRKDI